jgi:histidinol-phosphate phosphatase family protein
LPLSPRAKRDAEQRAEADLAARKAELRALIGRLKSVVDPPLSNRELSEALGFVRGPGRTSPIGRFVSEKSRHRAALPDALEYAILSQIADGSAILAIETQLGGSRSITVCTPDEAARMGRGFMLVNVAGGSVLPVDDWDHDELFDPLSGGAPTTTQPRVRSSRVAAGSSGASVPVRRVLLGAGGPTVAAVGLGAMRLSTRGRPEPREAALVIHAALDAGMDFIDTADVYGLDDQDLGHNERLIAGVLRERGDTHVIVATKAGLARPKGRWVPSGRPAHLLAAAEASLVALQTERLDLFQLHARDKTVPFADQIGALAALHTAGKIARVGLCNVTVEECEQANAIVPITTVQNKGGALQPGAFKSGVARWCQEHGATFIAHSPLGGHARSEQLAGHPVLMEVAARAGCSPQQLALAWLLTLGPGVLLIPGATRTQSALSSAAVLQLALSSSDVRSLDAAFRWASEARVSPAQAPAFALEREAVIVMGSPAAGKTSHVLPWVEQGYTRLNRDDRGGTLADLLPAMRTLISQGHSRFVLDNTYPSRKSRRGVIETAAQAGLQSRCVWIDTPPEAAMINACMRIIDRHGRLLEPDALAKVSRADPNMFPPAVIWRYAQALEPPSTDEGFTSIERVEFRRSWPVEYTRPALFLDFDGTLRRTRSGRLFPIHPDDVEVLPGRTTVLQDYVRRGFVLVGVSNQSGVARGDLTEDLAIACFERTVELLGVEIDVLFCQHRSKPVHCWCRKPLPGMGVSAIVRHKIDVSASLMVGDLQSDEEFARILGVAYRTAEEFFSPETSP